MVNTDALLLGMLVHLSAVQVQGAVIQYVYTGVTTHVRFIRNDTRSATAGAVDAIDPACATPLLEVHNRREPIVSFFTCFCGYSNVFRDGVDTTVDILSLIFLLLDTITCNTHLRTQ